MAVFKIMIFIFMSYAIGAPRESEPPVSQPNPKPETTVFPGSTHQPYEFPFRVCEMNNHGDIFRFATRISCPNFNLQENHTEGILIVFKDNIIPYTFNVRAYTKVVTTVTVYNGWYADAVTNAHEERYSVPDYELENMDTLYQCYNSVRMVKAGVERVYVDRDDKNITVNLRPASGISTGVRRYNSQPDLYDDPGWMVWTYRRRTTVNCMITDMQAKSNSPFNFFVTTLGQTVEMSPFYNGSNSETFNEPAGTFEIREKYKIVTFENRGTIPKEEKRAFLNKDTYTLSWKLDARSSYCPLTMWKDYSVAIRTDDGSSFHFITPQGTASFVTNTTHEKLPDQFKCIEQQVNKTITEQFAKLSNKYDRDEAEIQYFRTAGGLLLAWLPVTPKSLITIRDIALNNTEAQDGKAARDQPPDTANSPTPQAPPLRRNRREAGSDRNTTNITDVSATTEGTGDKDSILGTIDNPATAQIQFAYDSLRSQINRMLGDLASAWCQEQRRQNMVLNELTKINPTTVMTGVYGYPVAAKRIGDVISVSRCVPVEQESVSLRKSMRVLGSETSCYTRPLVSFSFPNDSKTYEGQLGQFNEILLTKKMVENCQDTCQHYFQSGNEMHVFRDYQHFKTIPVEDVATLQTFITLNTSFITNIDFQTLELYSRDERRASNVFDIEGIFREYNFQTQNIANLRRDLDNAISNNRNQFVDGLGELTDSLGAVGQAITNIVSSVGGLFSSLISGFISFFKNPFGGVLILAGIVAVIFLVIFLVRQNRTIAQQPVQFLYPEIQSLTKNREIGQSNVAPISKQQLDAIMLALYEQTAKRTQAESKTSDSTTSLPSRALEAARNRLRLRKKPGRENRSDLKPLLTNIEDTEF
ncbi:ORF4 [callitrichine gammaherpesvirus 3]|uniref:ORF4 n=1 Tax=callitrichine gammaherpesvirus 3 TaxID=106331 RepID=Q993K7_9GAMA|nr:ORF4 [callitrichine gammaherpesvirus 3]AAK38211.1 ORF4 [callitrichine gammaherpesvirus 3]